MIPVKLLKIENVEPVGVDNLNKFIQGMGFTIPEDGNGSVKENINQKVFLLGVINSNIPRMLEEWRPAGLTNWALFLKLEQK